MKKIFIAGGAGYIGTRLCNELCDKYEITVLDHFWFGDHLDNKIIKKKADLKSLKSEDLIGFDTVIFLAGLSNDPMAMYRPDLNFVENAAAPAFLAFITKEAGVTRFICASSCSVYGHSKNKTLDENSVVKPEYAYGISKLQCEQGVNILEDQNFKPIIFRKATLGGWSTKMRFDLVVNTMTMSALTKNVITINSPDLWRPLIDIRDIIQGYELAIEAPIEVSGVYNISGGNYTIGDLGKLVQKKLAQMNVSAELNILDVKDVRNYKVCTAKIKDELGFEARFSPEDSVGEIVKNVSSPSFNFNDKKYYNIETFRSVVK